MTELPLEGVPVRLIACTPSRLNTWLDCPRRYRFAYVDRPTPPRAGAWAHLSLGASVHNALRTWWSLPVNRRTPEAAAREVHEQWLPDGFRDAEQSDEYRQRSADWVATYVETCDVDSEPLGTERTVAAKTPQLALSGRVDRIDERSIDGSREAVIVDYKTGRRAVTLDDARASLALAVYAYAVSSTLRLPCWQVELHHVPSGEITVWRHTEETLKRHIARATEIAQESRLAESTAEQSDSFQPRPGIQCTWCDFRAACPAGAAASPEVDPWSSLP